MRIVGAGFLLFGTIFLCEAGFPFGGPSPLKSIVPSEGVSISSVWKSGPQLEAFAQEGI